MKSANICFCGNVLYRDFALREFFSAEQSDNEGGKEYTIMAVTGIVLAILGVALMIANVEYNSSHPYSIKL